MRERQLGSMKEVPARLPVLLNEFRVLGFTINVVPHYGMAKRTEMNPNLMGTACLNPHFKQGKTPDFFDRPVRAKGHAASSLLHAHPGAYVGMPSNVQRDVARRLRHLSMHEGEITFFHRPFLKGPAQTHMGIVVLCHNQEAGGPFVDPMNDSGPGLSSRAGQVLEAKQQRVNDGFNARSCTRMNRETRRLLNHGEIVILE
jgi:hypothetical protein